MELLKKLFKGDKVVWIIYLVFCLVSVIEVFSASSSMTYQSGAYLRPITMHITYLLVGTIVILIAHNIPTRWYGLLSTPLLFISWILLVVTLFIGKEENGGARWLDLGFIQFQPSEIAKMATIATVAYILSKLQNEGKSANPKAFKYILCVTGVSCALIFTENLSTALLLAISVFGMMIIGRIPWKQVGILCCACLAAVSVGVITLESVPAKTWRTIHIERPITWKSRIDKFFDNTYIPPKKYDIDTNGQRGHANIAIANSHLLGRGPGNSVQRDFLSQAYSDFIFAIIIEELGLIPAAFIAMLYVFLLIRIAKIANKSDKYYSTFLIMGIGFLITTQALFNMLVAVDIMPITGQPLPFISKGGTSTLVNCAYIGIILGISRHVNELSLKHQQEEEEKQRQIQEAAEAILLNAAANLNTPVPANEDSETSLPKSDTESIG